MKDALASTGRFTLPVGAQGLKITVFARKRTPVVMTTKGWRDKRPALLLFSGRIGQTE